MVNCDAKSFTRMRALHSNGSIYALRLDVSDWKVLDESPIQVILKRDHGYSSAEILFHNRPCHDAVCSVSRFRDASRIAATLEEGALISADLIRMRHALAATCITKIPQPSTGMTYHGVLVIPFHKCHATISVSCREDGLAGFRDTAVYTELTLSGKPIENWQQDPYDSDVCDHLMRNMSEDERYDRHFPDHPLSRLRQYLRDFARSFNYDRRVLEQPVVGEPNWFARMFR